MLDSDEVKYEARGERGRKIVIRFRLKELLAEKEFQEKRRITYEEVATQTGIHRTTLSKIANQIGYNTTTDVIDKLCVYFGVDVGDIAQFVENN